MAPFIILLYYQIHSSRKLKQVTSQLTSSVVAETKNSCSDIFVSLRILTCSLACKIIKTWSSSCVCIYVCVCGPPCVHECMCVCVVLCVVLCCNGCVWCVWWEHNMIWYYFSGLTYIYIFVDLIICRALTLVGETQHYSNNHYYYHTSAASQKTWK